MWLEARQEPPPWRCGQEAREREARERERGFFDRPEEKEFYQGAQKWLCGTPEEDYNSEHEEGAKVQVPKTVVAKTAHAKREETRDHVERFDFVGLS